MSGTNYFSYFPTVTYQDVTGKSKIAIDVFKRAKMVNMRNIIQSSTFYKYTIQDGERPEDIADRYYGDTQYYWIILYANEILNVPAQWPRSYRQFEKYIISKYGSVEYAANRTSEASIHHYEDEDGNWITKKTWLDQGAVDSRAITIYDYEYNLNEDKREIVIVRAEYLVQIITEMNNIFKG
jgi:hypothetical protein